MKKSNLDSLSFITTTNLVKMATFKRLFLDFFNTWLIDKSMALFLGSRTQYTSNQSSTISFDFYFLHGVICVQTTETRKKPFDLCKSCAKNIVFQTLAWCYLDAKIISHENWIFWSTQLLMNMFNFTFSFLFLITNVVKVERQLSLSDFYPKCCLRLTL